MDKRYTRARAFSDSSLEAALNILEELYPNAKPSIASNHQDKKQATDAIILDSTSTERSVAIRSRNPQYWKYRGEFTVRCSAHGEKSEHDKFMDGSTALMFYYHLDESGNIRLWHLLDLSVWRKEAKDVFRSGGAQKKFNDRSSHGKDINKIPLMIYKIGSFSKELVIASSYDHKELETSADLAALFE